jgi:hypothetical protein
MSPCLRAFVASRPSVCDALPSLVATKLPRVSMLVSGVKRSVVAAPTTGPDHDQY